MSGRTKMATIIAMAGLGLAPATALATPGATVAPDGSSVTVSDASCTTGPGVGTHQTKECGKVTIYRNASEPQGNWCGQVAGVGACVQMRDDGTVPGVAGVCTWYYDDWQPNTSPNSCVNGRGCSVLAVIENPNGCGD